MSFTFCAQKVLGESCCWGGVTGESPRWRSSLLCQQSGRCWGSSVWRVPLWTELPAAPQLPLDRTAIAATYNAAAAWDWQRRGHTVKQNFHARITSLRHQKEVLCSALVHLSSCMLFFLCTSFTAEVVSAWQHPPKKQELQCKNNSMTFLHAKWKGNKNSSF